MYIFVSTSWLHCSLQKVEDTAVLDRLTDTSKYTGSHKLRFDESGKGKGLEGRDSVAKGPGYIPPLVSEQPSYVSGNRIGLDALDTARAENSPRAIAKANAARASPRVQSKVGTASTSAKASPKIKSTAATSSPRSSTKSKPKVNHFTWYNIFSLLTSRVISMTD